mmetsp:Transcript_37455/g.112333  ORF Transcript_37455/g.112333 Transcript_37455/m.112333 type:complete len:86 (+) Transcript_37455:1410-1667(+)
MTAFAFIHLSRAVKVQIHLGQRALLLLATGHPHVMLLSSFMFSLYFCLLFMLKMAKRTSNVLLFYLPQDLEGSLKGNFASGHSSR